MRILLIQNCPLEGFGRYEAYLAERGYSYRVLHPYRRCEFPPVNEYDVFFVGGTPISAVEVDEHEFLHLEWHFLADVLESQRPYFGICFGGQLLARLLTGNVRRGANTEIGGYEVDLTRLGQSDPLFENFPDRFPVFQWHSDVFEPNPDAATIAAGWDGTAQAFRMGTAVGLQFHLEVTSTDAAVWADAYLAELTLVGKDKVTVVAECREREARMAHLANTILDNYFKLIE